jgi:hypothetical protein
LIAVIQPSTAGLPAPVIGLFRILFWPEVTLLRGIS